MNILEIENLSFGYGSFHQRLGDKVLKDINFCIDEGESVGVLKILTASFLCQPFMRMLRSLPAITGRERRRWNG